MLVAMKALGICVLRELGHHLLNIHQAIRVPPEKNDGCGDVASGEARWAVRADGCPHDRRQDIIVVHLECSIAHDLEPVHDRFDGREGVEMRVCSNLLSRGDVVTVPVEQPDERPVDDSGEDGWIYNGLPHRRRRENGFAAEEEEQKSGPSENNSEQESTKDGSFRHTRIS